MQFCIYCRNRILKMVSLGAFILIRVQRANWRSYSCYSSSSFVTKHPLSIGIPKGFGYFYLLLWKPISVILGLKFFRYDHVGENPKNQSMLKYANYQRHLFRETLKIAIFLFSWISRMFSKQRGRSRKTYPIYF